MVTVGECSGVRRAGWSDGKSEILFWNWSNGKSGAGFEKMIWLVQIDAPQPDAAIIVASGEVVFATPALGWAVGKSATEIYEWCERKGYQTSAARIASRRDSAT